MSERRDRFRLAHEPSQSVGISCDGLREYLDCDVPASFLSRAR